jgi:hypothetical protein
LASGTYVVDGFYNGATIVMTSGSCLGDSGTVTNYNGTTMFAGVIFTGTCVPSSGNAYMITPAWMLSSLIASGALGASGTSMGIPYVTLPMGSSTVGNFYNNDTLTVTSGTCAGDTGTITAYGGSSFQASVSLYGCSAGPASGSGFTITPAQPVGTAFAAYGAVVAATATSVQLASTSSTSGAYYTNNIMTMLPTGSCAGDTATITQYIGGTTGPLHQTATVSFPGCTPGAGDPYAITPPLNVSYSGILAGVSSFPNVTLASTSSPVNNYYDNAIITMTSGACNTDSGQITGYNGSTMVAVISWIGCTGGLTTTDNYTITPSAPASYSGALPAAGTSSGVTLAPGASWANGFYTNAVITMTNGSCGSGTITNYVGMTLQATVSFPGCSGGPSAGATYTITPAWWVAPVAANGTVVTATVSSVTLQGASLSSINGLYNNASLIFTSGICSGKSTNITNYTVGTSKVASVTLGCVPASNDGFTIGSNYELGYADFSARAEWPRPIVLGHAIYLAQEYKFHSRGDYFENTVELVGSGSSTGCTLSASPGYCNPPNAAPLADFVAPENEVSRGVSTLYEDGSFFMPANLQSVESNSSGQVNTYGVLGSLTLANPQLLSAAAPLMTMCLNTSGHSLNVGDVVSLQANGGGTSYNDCIDPTTYVAGGSGTPAEFRCFIVTAPTSALVSTFPNGQPVTLAMPGSQVMASVTPGGAVINSGALLLPMAPSGGINGSLTAVDPASATLQQVAQACAYAVGSITTTGAAAGTLIRALVR